MPHNSTKFILTQVKRVLNTVPFNELDFAIELLNVKFLFVFSYSVMSMVLEDEQLLTCFVSTKKNLFEFPKYFWNNFFRVDGWDDLGSTYKIIRSLI